MQLPIDIKALLDEATNNEAARSTELSVSVYIDGHAPADLVAHVRGMFASTLPTVRLALSYLDASFAPYVDDDMAVIVAGSSAGIGAAASAVRSVGVPVMVVTTEPSTVNRLSTERGYAIPDGDVIAPCDSDAEAEPFALDEELTKRLDERMGRWIVSVCHEKRLAFAVAFPFVRKPLAKDAVQATSLQNAGIGLLPIIPGADLPILTLNQAKMALQIAAAYGHEMDKGRLKELAAVIGGAYVCRTLARELTELVPVLGFLVKPGVAFGGTAALGNAIIEYFEGGENVSGVAAAVGRASETASKALSKANSVVSKYAPALGDALSNIITFGPSETKPAS